MVVGQIYSAGVRAQCDACGKDIGFITWQEVAGVMGMGEGFLCFDCDSKIANCVPSELLPFWDYGKEVTIMIGKKGEGQISIAWDTACKMAVRKES